MNGFFSAFYWDNSYNVILLANLAICIALFTSLRLFSGAIAHVSAWDELVNRDNPAFGISLGGAVFGVTIVLTGAVYAKQAQTLAQSVIAVSTYGGIGIILMAVTRLIFDKIALPRMYIRDEIEKENVVAGIIDAGNIVATAIIIRTVTQWVEVSTLNGILALLTGYVISQVLLTAATYLRLEIFALRNKASMQTAFKEGNVALALHFVGRRIGTAFAVTAASNIMVYEEYNIYQLLFSWAVISVVVTVVLSALSYIADKIILYNIDSNKEIVQQKNIAIGILQGVIYICLGMLLAQLMT